MSEDPFKIEGNPSEKVLSEPARSREYFTLKGEPLSVEARVEAEEEERKHLLGTVCREAKKEVEFINFDLLETLYKQVLEKSGLGAEQTNFLKPDRILLVTPGRRLEDGAEGVYHARGNIILVDYEKAKKIGKEFGSEKMEVTRLLCHEEVHATTKSVCMGSNEQVGAGKGDITQVGYDRVTGDKNGYQILFRYINEGVTEKLARDIFNEYASGSGDYSKKEVNKFKDAHYSAYPSYTTNVALVEALVDRLAFETETQKDYVWHAIVRGAYNGDQLDSPELKQMIVDTLGSDIYERLCRIDEDVAKGMPYKADELIRDIKSPLDEKDYVDLPHHRRIPKLKKAA